MFHSFVMANQEALKSVMADKDAPYLIQLPVYILISRISIFVGSDLGLVLLLPLYLSSGAKITVTSTVKFVAMSRRPVNPSRRYGESGGSGGGLFSFNSKSRSARYFPVLLIVLGTLVIFAYLYRGSGGLGGNIGAFSRIEGGFSCTAEVHRAIPVLKKAYGDGMHKVLHVGPDTCLVVSNLRKEDETEAWGVEPYDIEDADGHCRALVSKGIVRIADIKFPLPYRPKSFSLVIVSDALDYLSPRYLNKTLPDLARVSTGGLVIFTGFPGQHRVKDAEASKIGRAAKLRSSSWWARYFIQTSLQENEAALKKFEKAAAMTSYNPSCQIFHLKAYT